MASKNIFSAVSIIIGTAVGAGIFALPYAFAKSGVGVGLAYLIALGVVTLVITLAYGEVTLRTTERLQVVGYTKKYLGSRWRIVALISFLFGITGALIAYPIAVGEFIETLFGQGMPGGAFEYGLLYFLIAAAIVFAGLGMVVYFERIMVVALVAVVLLVIGFGIPHVDPQNWTGFSPVYMFLPYGVILFALSAASAVPDAMDALADKRKLKRAIIIGMAVPLIIYGLFSLVLVGITGTATHEGAIPGLVSIVHPWIVIGAIIFGIFSMTTSFLALGLVIREIYQFDFRLSKGWAWLAAMVPPFLIYFFQLSSFVEIISLVGGVMGGFDGIIILLLWRKAREKGNRQPEFTLTIPRWAQVLMFSVFILGIVYQLVSQISL
ncbi:MAG: aromatic amino acid transport family protein [bacterium]|nr:aromatic amino acid transport family protein [bacterium]